MERENTLQLPVPCDETMVDYEKASRLIRPLKGKFYAVEPGQLERIGSIWLSDGAGTSLQSDLLTVLAVGAGVCLCPGDRVLVRPTHGDWVEGFEIPGYRAPQRVRVYGTACEFQGEPVAVAWDECAPVKINYQRVTLKDLVDGRYTPAPGLTVSTDRGIKGEAHELMILEATGKNILIRRDPTVTSESGLELPESAQYRTCLATIVSVGSLVREVKVGDRVHYNPLGLLDFMFGEDKDLAVCQELGINAVIAPVEVAA